MVIMKSIECLNFVSHDAPNILLIADIINSYARWRNINNFQKTHNIYVMLHNFDDNLIYHSNLPSKHNEIVAELDKHNLHKFTISAFSFGSFMSFYLIYHLPERVEKALLHDFYLHASSIYSKYDISFDNWLIPKRSTTPILFFLNQDKHVPKKEIKLLKSIFTNIRFLTIFKKHTNPIVTNFLPEQKILFTIFNGTTIKYFWKNIYPKWIYNDNLPIIFKIYPHHFMLKIFIKITTKIKKTKPYK